MLHASDADADVDVEEDEWERADADCGCSGVKGERCFDGVVGDVGTKKICYRFDVE